MKEIKIGSRVVQEFTPPFVIAEIGANYNGDIEVAKEMVIKARDAGVECAKFQSWTKESIMSRELYDKREAELTVFGHKTQSELLDYLSMSEKDHFVLKEFCDSQGIMFSTTPISFRHVDLMADLDVPFFKIASMDVNHPLFIEYIGKKGKPTILSTGMSSIREVATAVDAFLS
nr:N-acetylneuraminate synthase family protein [Rhodothermaceae bacterium]